MRTHLRTAQETVPRYTAGDGDSSASCIVHDFSYRCLFARGLRYGRDCSVISRSLVAYPVEVAASVRPILRVAPQPGGVFDPSASWAFGTSAGELQRHGLLRPKHCARKTSGLREEHDAEQSTVQVQVTHLRTCTRFATKHTGETHKRITGTPRSP